MKFNFWEWLDKRHINHRLVLWVTVGLSAYVIIWSLQLIWYLATNDKLTGVDLAACLAAIAVPVNGLQGWVFQTYSARKNFINPHKGNNDIGYSP